MAGDLIEPVADAAAFGTLLADARLNAVLVGPGGGVDARTREQALTALALDRRVVLDADPIRVFEGGPGNSFRAVGSVGKFGATPPQREFRLRVPVFCGSRP